MESDSLLIDHSVVNEKYVTYRIVMIRPSGYQHSSALLEIAETLMYGLKCLGYTALIVENEFSQNSDNIVLGAHLLQEDELDTLPGSTIIYNLEQFDSQSLLNHATLNKYKRFIVWDYSKRNIEKFRTLGLGNPMYHVPIGYVPELTRITKSSIQDIDVLFYGSINERRTKIIEELRKNGLNVVSLFGVYGEERDAVIARAKIVINIHYYHSSILELARISYLLANSKAVLAECNEGTEIEGYLKEAIALAPYEKLVETCIELIKNDKQRQWFENNGFECFSKRKESEILREVLTQLEITKVFMTEKVVSQVSKSELSAMQVFDLQEVVYILRRIENNIDKEHNLIQLVQLVASNRVVTSDVIRIIQKDMIKKAELLQTISTACYKQGMTDFFPAF